jgi:uncharacterized membrane protein HdeD (DUF308 family)
LAASTAATLSALVFMIVRVVSTVHAFRSRRWGRFFLELILGLFYIGSGVFLVLYPLGGIVTLTLVLSIFYLSKGAFKVIQASRVRPAANWGWMLFSGALSLALGFLLILGMPLPSPYCTRYDPGFQSGFREGCHPYMAPPCSNPPS